MDGVREARTKGGRAGFVGARKRMKRKTGGGGGGKERERGRALGIVSMTYVALTLSAKRL